MSNSSVSGQPKITNIEIIGLIGAGGMSRVYKARQSSLDRLVAVKVLAAELLDSEKAKNNFDAEIQLTSSLRHENIVQVLGAGVEDGGAPYLILEYLEGKSMSQLIKEKAPLSYKQFAEIFLPLLSALQHAHERGILHRDIKPSNIIIMNDESGALRPQLLDFGIAKLLSANQSLKQTMDSASLAPGSPLYMSPEQCTGQELDGRSDLYSLALVMYEALSGEPLIKVDSAYEALYKQINERSLSVRELCQQIKIPEELAQVLQKALRKDRDMRFADENEFSERLRRALDAITLEEGPQRLARENASLNSARLYIMIPLLVVCLLAALLCFQSSLSPRNTAELPLKKTAGKLMYEARRHFDERNTDAAVKEYLEAAAILERGGSKEDLANCYYGAACALSAASGDMKKVAKFAGIAEVLYAACPPSRAHSMVEGARLRKFDALARQGDKAAIRKALDEYLRASQSDTQKVIRSEQAADVLIKCGLAEEGLKICENALRLARKESDLVSTPYNLLTQHAQMQSMRGQFKQAISEAKYVLPKLVKESILPPSQRAQDLERLSLLLLNDDPEFVRRYLEYELKNNGSIYSETSLDLARVKLDLAAVYMKIGLKEEAKNQLFSSLESASNCNSSADSTREECFRRLGEMEENPAKKDEYRRKQAEFKK